MRRQFVRIVMLVLLLLVTAQVTRAQYAVQNGDSLWKIAGKELLDAREWEKIYADNPFLAQEHRRFEKDGVIYVLLKPGEVLKGFDPQGGITPTLEELKTPDAKVVEVEKPRTFWEKLQSGLWGLVWFLVFCCLLAMYIAMRDSVNRWRNLRKDPVTSGLPVVQGGVTSEAAPARFQEQAARQWQRETLRTASSSLFTILRSVRGRGWGIIDVGYADGTHADRRLNGEVVYQAEVRFPDGKTETLYMLQGCGNDLRFGNIRNYTPAEGFRFEPDVATVTPAVTAPVAEVAQVVATPVPVVETTPIEDGVVRIELKPLQGDKPAMVRLTGIDESRGAECEIRDGSITVRYTPRSK